MMLRKNAKKLISIAIGIFFILLFPIAVQTGGIANYIYQMYFYPYFSGLLRLIFGWIPISVGDLFYLCLIVGTIGIIYQICKSIFHKKFGDALQKSLRGVNIFVWLYVVFLMVWGGNYYRDTFAKTLGLPKHQIEPDELLHISKLMVKKCNESYPYWKKESFSTFSGTSFQLYQSEVLSHYPHRSFKKSIWSTLISKLGVMGYYQPFLAEGTLNIHIPDVDIPFTTCHEMAHQKGIAYEDEAHLMAVWLIKNNGNTQFKFSMYINMLDYLLPQLKRTSPQQFKTIETIISPPIKLLLKQRAEYWKSQTGPLDELTTFLFDKLLKANHQKEGIKSYEGISDWLYALYKDEIINQKSYLD